jgi:ABC-2 type transport system ATP-binding protein
VELDRPIRDLSKGNRQKIGLVQALVHRPDLLMLDEPTSGLDPLMQDEFHRLVSEAADAGQTVFLSSHSLDEVQRLADRVGIIREGRLVDVDTVEDLEARAVRMVTIRFAERVDPAELTALDGVDDLATRDDEVCFAYQGDMDVLVKAIARHRVADLTSQAVDLERIFLDYYRGDPGTDDGGAGAPADA